PPAHGQAKARTGPAATRQGIEGGCGVRSCAGKDQPGQRSVSLCPSHTMHRTLLNTPGPWLLAAFIGITFLGGCKKERDVAVPLVPVDITINLNLPEYNALQVTGGWAYVIGGSEGLIVYRVSPDQFSALDRHCTYQGADQCRVTVDDSQVI